MAWHNRPDETDIRFGDGAPTATVYIPTKYIDRLTGACYVNLATGAGATWYQVSGGFSVGNSSNLLTAAKTITVADHGKDFFLGAAGGFAITLPTAAAALRGLRFRAFVEVAPTTAYTIETGNSSEQLMAGTINSSTGGNADSEAAFTGTTLTFVANTSTIGDWAEVVSAGATGWIVTGFCDADAAMTITG